MNFAPSEVEHIASIPTSARLPEDKLIRYFEKDREYSVRSTYHLSRRILQYSKAGTSSNMEGDLWKHLWMAPLHERTKNIWRLLNNILLTNCNLEKKGIKLDISCPFCHMSPETTSHVFLQCDFSKTVFFSSPLDVHFSLSGDVYDWLAGVLKKKD